MRILCPYKVPSFFAGGIPKFIINLYFNKQNNFKNKNITLISINNQFTKNTIFKKYQNNLNEIIFPGLLNFKTISFSIKFFIYILLNSRKFDFIHYQHPDPFSALGIILSKFYNRKTKVIITWHADVYKNYLFAAPILIIIDLILFLISYKIVYLTPLHLKSSLLGKLPIFYSKKEFIPNGIVLPKNTILEKRDPLKNKKLITFISIGRLVKYKGLEYALKSLNILLKKKPEINFRYLIIGSGPEERSLKNLTNDLGLTKYIEFKGEINESEKTEYLKNSDIYLFPSINQSEAYGLSQLEAISMGIPVINTNLNNGVNYLVPHNVCGITVEKQCSELIFKAILTLYYNHHLYFNFSKNGIKRSKEFSIERTRSLYTKLLNI